MWRLANICLSATLLAGCSTSDVLTLNETPPAPVGQAPAQTAYASQQPIMAAPEGIVTQQSLPAPVTYSSEPAYPASSYPAQAYPAQAYPDQTVASATDATPGIGRAPSTFGAQAASIAPASPAPAVAQPQPVAVQQQAVAAQQYPASIPAVSTPPPATAIAQPPTTVASVQPSQSLAAAPAADTIRFLPIIGAPESQLVPLSQRLGTSARAAGLEIAGMSDSNADVSLKGYFSASEEDGRVTVTYMWDVIAPDGKRIHRLQGKETGPQAQGSADPWASVTPDMMAAIGQNSIGDLVAWLDTRGS